MADWLIYGILAHSHQNKSRADDSRRSCLASWAWHSFQCQGYRNGQESHDGCAVRISSRWSVLLNYLPFSSASSSELQEREEGGLEYSPANSEYNGRDKAETQETEELFSLPTESPSYPNPYRSTLEPLRPSSQDIHQSSWSLKNSEEIIVGGKEELATTNIQANV